ncbi:metallophosphoesterase [Marinobacteraceae bacterium S3BR75-40.1]
MVQQHRYFEVNRDGRDYIVGDVHGEYDRLQAALAKVRFDAAVDRLFCVGDLVDRGPDSAALIALLDEPWCFSVIGNHEMMLLESEDNAQARMAHDLNGGDWFYRLTPFEQARIRGRVSQACALAFSVDTRWGTLGIIHATAPSDWSTVQEVPLEPGHWDELVWDRTDYRTALSRPELITPVRNAAYVVHGHVSCTNVLRVQNRFWIDTLYRGGHLSLVAIEQLPDWPQGA